LTASLARTPLYDRHVALGGRMVDFGGWELPQQYTSIRGEHIAVRKVAGLFDISHMGRVVVRGPGAAGFVQGLVTNDVSRLEPHRALYALMCREDGGVLDEIPSAYKDIGQVMEQQKDLVEVVAELRQVLCVKG